MAWYRNTVTGSEFDADPILEELIRKDRHNQYTVIEITGPGGEPVSPEAAEPAQNDEPPAPIEPPAPAPAEPAQTLPEASTEAEDYDTGDEPNAELVELTSPPKKPGRPRK